MRQYNVMTTPDEIRDLMRLAEKHLPDFGFDVKLEFEKVGQERLEIRL